MISDEQTACQVPVCLRCFWPRSYHSAAQQRRFSGAAEIEQSLHKLNELGTVLMIAAHPDDERTAVLAYFARGRHMRTAYLSLTRGEGGQNLIGSEQGAQLGIIRTQELLDARQIDGAEQFFTRAIDFGFTKTAAETLQKWGHDRILSDVVWVIRRYRPDVIILGFSGTPRDGHGQHQTSAILGKEAFDAAAIPKVSRSNCSTYSPGERRSRGWISAPEAGVWPGGRGARTGAAHAPAARSRSLPPRRKPARSKPARTIRSSGYSYDELAVLSRSMHHSQGTGAMRRPGGGDDRLRPGRRTAPPSKDPLRRHRHHLESAARRRGGRADARRGDPHVRTGASREGAPAAGEGAPADRGHRRPAGEDQARGTRRDHRALRRPLGGSAGARSRMSTPGSAAELHD